MAKRWRIATHDALRVAAMERSAGVSTVVAQLLLLRGIECPDAARHFLDTKLTGLRDPEELGGVSQAADLIHRAISAGKRIVVYGDYDADGMTATAILLGCLKLLRANCTFHVPNRMDDGYGLHCESLRQLKSQGAELVITVDCGIASIEQARTAAELGLELIITDHHQMADTLPQAAAVVHPRLPHAPYPFPDLCGAAVALKLAWALCQRASDAKRVSEPMRNFLLQAVGLAAIGTVADVVPLVDENRILVRHGLMSLRNYPTVGVRELVRLAKLDQKPGLEGEDLAFALAPRLNAAGRLGQAELAIELLTTTSVERAAELAKYLDELNESRKTLERSVTRSAQQQINDRFDPAEHAALVLADHDWHPGVIGIVAGKLAEKYHRPVVMIALDKIGVKPGSGSGRSVAGFNLHAALGECSEHLVSHGGHTAAAGFRIDERHVDAFRTAFCACAERCISTEQRTAELFVDAEVPLAGLTLQTVLQIDGLSPFGHGNERPMLCTSDVRLAAPPQRMGGAGRHLSLLLVQHGVQMRAVAFGNGDWETEISRVDQPISVAFRPVINAFRGRRSVEMHLQDWKREKSDV